MKRKVEGNPKVAIAYVRCSTDKQEQSPARQAAAIDTRAKAQDIEIVAYYIDFAVSGANSFADRPGLIAAHSAVIQANAGLLLMSDRSRLARDLLVARDIEEQFRKIGAKIVTADASDSEDANGKLSRNIRDVFYEHERDILRERTRSGMALKRARGECLGTPPYGYRVGADGKTLEVDKKEQELLAEVRRLHREGLSLRKIAARVVGRNGKRLGATQVVRMVKDISQ